VAAAALLAAGLASRPATASDLLGGQHWRLGTPRGVVHAWRPGAFEPHTAATVVYVHGYYTSADSAWDEDRLAEQFRDSGLNALFVVPEAPASGDEPVLWPSLSALLESVRLDVGATPGGPLVLVGHSGAWRTLETWLRDLPVAHLVLLDAVYGTTAPFRGWLASARSRASRLTVVSADTWPKAAAMVRGLRGVVRLPEVPASEAGLVRQARGARILLVKSQYEHHAIVSDGRVLPLVLRLSSPAPAAKPSSVKPVAKAARTPHPARRVAPGHGRSPSRPSP
jgi:hypothetical protein